MHQIRDYEAHRRNTWEWDKWGFTSEWDRGCTLSDIDGFYPHFAEVSNKFLIIEVKSWNGELPLPEINYDSGQARALKALTRQPNFTVVWAFGDTSTQTIYKYEVWLEGVFYEFNYDFKTWLTNWYKWARGN